MPGHETDVVPEREEPSPYRLDEGLVIAERKVRPADRSLEQDVADQREAGPGQEEDDMPGGMAGAVQDLDIEGRQMQPLPIDQPMIGLEDAAAFEPEHLGLTIEGLEPETIVDLRAMDGQARPPDEFGDATAVIDVAMGHEDGLQAGALVPADGQQAVDLAAGIDDDGPARGRVDEQAAVLLQRRHGKDPKPNLRIHAPPAAEPPPRQSSSEP